MTDRPEVKRDTSTGALYARLRQGDVRRTVAVSDSVNVDTDIEGQVLGIEMLSDTDWAGVLVTLAMAGRLVLREPGLDAGRDYSDDPAMTGRKIPFHPDVIYDPEQF
jgi:uncharacterized protein YuzE